MKELVEHKLISEEKLGDRKPNMIYVNTIEITSKSNIRSDSQNVGCVSPKIRESLGTKFGSHESQNVGLNNTNNYQTDFSDTNQSITRAADGMIGTTYMERYSFEELALHLKMDHLFDIHPGDQESLFNAGLIKIIVDELNKPATIVYLNKDNHISKATFEKRIYELTSFHFSYVYEAFTKYREPIKNIRSYLLTMIYNSGLTMNAYYTNRVNSEDIRV